MDVQLESTTKVPLSSIKQGECFEKYGDIYMKVSVGVVNLRTGCYFSNMPGVQKVRAVTLKCIEV